MAGVGAGVAAVAVNGVKPPAGLIPTIGVAAGLTNRPLVAVSVQPVDRSVNTTSNAVFTGAVTPGAPGQAAVLSVRPAGTRIVNVVTFVAGLRVALMTAALSPPMVNFGVPMALSTATVAVVPMTAGSPPLTSLMLGLAVR